MLRFSVADIITPPGFELSAGDATLEGYPLNETQYRKYYGNDIAVLKLSTPIEAGENISYASCRRIA